MTPYLGDFFKGDTISFFWNTFDSNGASITRATDGTISVREDGAGAQITNGVTDHEDFNGVTGVHKVTINTSNAAYEAGKDYAVVLTGATIDGQTVNGAIFHFSLENRTGFTNVNVGSLDSSALTQISGALNDITASEVWAEALGSTSLTASQLLQIIAGVAAGELSGAATTSVTIRNIQDSGNLVVATVDSDGNRSSINITNPTT